MKNPLKTPAKTLRGATARTAVVATTGLALAAASTTLASVPARAASKPTISKLSDVNINLGLTQRVTVHSVGATSYEWRMWTASQGWILLARGGTGYASINFTGDATRHMGVLQVTAINKAGRTVSNMSRLRVWGISSAYPAAAGTSVRTGGWQISLARSNYVTGDYFNGVQTRLTATKLANPAVEPVQAIEPNYVDTANIEHWGLGLACDEQTPAFGDITTLPAGASGSGYMCATGDDLTQAKAAGGRWKLEASPTAYGTPGPVAWFRGV